MSRNLLLCLDGTRNEPETGSTNVVRMFDMAVKDEDQLVYYDPGVGTMGARSATTPLGKRLTRVSGLVIGYGIRDNVEEAYVWLSEHYRPGDRIHVVGFSRGAYTSLALVGMLRTVGLVRPGAGNLAPYALKLYARNDDRNRTPAEEKAYWDLRDRFSTQFGNPDFNRFARNVAFLGLWDTVKTVGWLNARARFQQAQWPFTRKVSNVRTARLALALDEKRRPYPEYRFDRDEVPRRNGDLREMWFAGVHSDVGGGFAPSDGDPFPLADLALGWMADEAMVAGLRLDPEQYEHHLGVPPGSLLPRQHAVDGHLHPNSRWWVLTGPGRRREVRPNDELHPSVRQRVEATEGSRKPYRPDLRSQP